MIGTRCCRLARSLPRPESTDRATLCILLARLCLAPPACMLDYLSPPACGRNPRWWGRTMLTCQQSALLELPEYRRVNRNRTATRIGWRAEQEKGSHLQFRRSAANIAEWSRLFCLHRRHLAPLACTRPSSPPWRSCVPKAAVGEACLQICVRGDAHMRRR
jgi:hypothetical protein